jgi:hypothetical protein
VVAGIFVVLLAAVYYLHVLYFDVDVVFYSAILDGVIAAAATGLIVFFVPFFSTFGRFEKALLVVLCVGTGYVFAISVPTVLDRSLSFYILEKLQQRGGAIPYADFDRVFKDEYMKEHHLVDIRLTEQKASGTIRVDDGVVRLTPLGAQIAQWSRFFRTHFLAKHRLLNGQYTDVLTDPFRGETTNKP